MNEQNKANQNTIIGNIMSIIIDPAGFFFISNCKIYGTVTSIAELLVVFILGHVFIMKQYLCMISYLTLSITYLLITGYWYKKQIKCGNSILNNAKGQCAIGQCDSGTQQCTTEVKEADLPTPHKCFIGTPDPYVTLYSKYVASICVFILGTGICCLRKNYGLCESCDTAKCSAVTIKAL